MLDGRVLGISEAELAARAAEGDKGCANLLSEIREEKKAGHSLSLQQKVAAGNAQPGICMITAGLL
jgi:hypothetical protein